MHDVYFAKEYCYTFQTFSIQKIEKDGGYIYEVYNVSNQLSQFAFSTYHSVNSIVKIIENAFHRQDLIVTSIDVKEEDEWTTIVEVNYLFEKGE